MKVLSRINSQSTFITSLLSILLGMLIGAIMMVVAGYDPIAAYNALFVSALVQPYDLGETLRTITPLILTGLAVALAFRTGLFNIGVEGQFIVGQLVAIIVGLKLNLPPVLHAVVAVIAGGLAGAVWGLVPGLLKATRGVHEVIISIMMNFIALYLSNALVFHWMSNGADSTPKIMDSASLRIDAVSQMFGGARLHFGLILAILAAFVMYVLVWRTRLGYELRAVGHNPLAAEYAGMSVKRNIILSMMFSGTFAGLAGAGEALGTSGYLAIQPAFTGIGFDGIAVALLGASTPLGVVLASVLFGILTYGGGNMQFEAGVPFEVIRVVFAAIILFVAANVTGRLLGKFSRNKGGDKRA
ncbi:branched-chain amino acid ABC transporter permease [Laceyella sacchari]|jgi:simple sugar transport system permease protein|uniref:Simple sugar transport system permease protein n=2 Tax=Laceyella TaxID=292635 RepID=A0AA45WS20_9BACL|nr:MULTISPECIES: ABC transporter permease [Laceyella]AUS09087.1 branched-chain amino acid ABC transporter permease [Laceyella sacchari]MRG29052.1 ABC transporter permease [Laceyella tengchongensis]PRZ15503.1 simple sugar transport system permease protein [Laceyella sediminis]SMP33714.1 simple sugar transport system permease protein [Laceyella tengchongensis]